MLRPLHALEKRLFELRGRASRRENRSVNLILAAGVTPVSTAESRTGGGRRVRRNSVGEPHMNTGFSRGSAEKEEITPRQLGKLAFRRNDHDQSYCLFGATLAIFALPLAVHAQPTGGMAGAGTATSTATRAVAGEPEGGGGTILSADQSAKVHEYVMKREGRPSK